jgi:hypothetical protein
MNRLRPDGRREANPSTGKNSVGRADEQEVGNSLAAQLVDKALVAVS